MMTTERVCNGIFRVFWNGQETKYEIVNSCIGLSGNSKNEYLIVTKDSKRHTHIGSLAKAKKTVAFWLEKDQKL
jgi:hypothetical protein